MTGVQTLNVAAGDGDQRLDRWLKRQFPHLTQGQIEKMCRKGDLRVEGGRVKSSTRVEAGQSVRIPPLPDPGTRPAPDAARISPADAKMIQSCVIYRDDHIIALNKPPGLPVQGGSKQMRHVDGLADALRFGSEARPRLVHRLDKDTSGVLILARTREAAKARRRAQSTQGKRGTAGGTDRTRGTAAPAAAAATPPPPAAAPVARPEPSPRRSSGPSRRTAPAVASTSSTRELARRRRSALAEAGRKAEATRDRTRADAISRPRGGNAEAGTKGAGKKGDCGCGCKGEARADAAPAPASERRASLTPTSRTSPGRGQPRRVNATMAPARAASRARRAAQSATGKSASSSATSMAGIARQANPRMSSRDLARSIREQRSRNGRSSSTKSAPCGRVRPSRTAGDPGERGAQDATWKVGASETGGGQTVTGTRVGRAKGMTGDEPSTCRAVTGTEYMGADIFREFCQTDPPRSPLKVGVSPTTRGNRVTGNEVGRSSQVTGDEPGTCKNVTGTEYLSAEQFDAFCGTRPAPSPAKVSRTQTTGGQRVSGVMVGRSSKVTGDEHGAGVRTTGSQYTQPQDIQSGGTQSRDKGGQGGVPSKVGTSTTFTGGTVTGTRTGRSERVTGDEPGSCKRVTGDEYVDLNQYEAFCASRPEPSPPKVESTHTLVGRTVTGTRTGRAANVTGDEPGTCKSVTGTPYGPAEDYEAFCAPQAGPTAMARAHRRSGPAPGANLTGIQPGVGGVMTGAGRGACEPVSGTPYVGSDDFGDTCGALPGQEDFPRALDGAPWQSFSVESPARAAHQARAQGGVTGTRYEQGQITGAFNMGTGKVTGTEEFRFDHRRAGNANLMDMAPASPASVPAAAAPAAEEKSRVTGEGQSAGLKITGDDWDRNERVTGTEGTSAMRRNPTRRGGPTSVMLPPKRNVEAAEPVSLVTGSAGTTDTGALITYSGGARG